MQYILPCFVCSLREKCGLHTPIFLRFARQSLTHLHAFFDGVHTSMLALLRHPKWTFFSVIATNKKKKNNISMIAKSKNTIHTPYTPRALTLYHTAHCTHTHAILLGAKASPVDDD